MNTVVESNENLLDDYPEVKDLLSPITQVILASAEQIQIPAGAHLIRETERCQNFMWLLQGTVRVFKHSPTGREITLYRVTPGELCVLSMQCLLWDEGFPAEVVAETDLVALTLSKDEFDRAIDDSREFRRALLKILSQRMGDIVQLVSEVTFQRLDLRLACLLGQLFERSGGEPLKITHAQIARELGTTREMVSRILKEFEHQQCIRLLRGVIHLVSREGLSWFGR
ncbi:MAG: Crp/Fnr family transcriptional regulator [Thiogranum sp.]